VGVRNFRIIGESFKNFEICIPGLAGKFFFHVAVFIIFFRFFLKLLSLSSHYGCIGGGR